MHSSATPRVHPSLPVTLFICVLVGRVLWDPADGLAAQTSRGRAAQQPPPETRVIEVIAKRYAFEPAEIHVTEGERVRLLVKSGDGLHGFEIKRFRVSKEIPRGSDPVAIEFTAEQAGRFPILCSVWCGDGHDAMKGALVVTAHGSAQP